MHSESTHELGATASGSEHSFAGHAPRAAGDDQGSLRNQLALAMLSLVTMFCAGLYAQGFSPFDVSAWGSTGAGVAAAYAGSLFTIVGAHELGHYLSARRRGVPASRPYLLPGIGPIPGSGMVPFFGTFGAFIRLQWSRVSATDLMAVAGWGPVAGFLVTVAVLAMGVGISEVVPISAGDAEGVMRLGDSLLMQAMIAWHHGALPADHEVALHPVALAGWVGCLLTSLNLLPIGQLDGGHLVYAVLGERARWVSYAGFALLVALGLLMFPGWLLFAGLLAAMGLRHPPMLSGEPLPLSRAWMLGAGVVMFALTFVPAPVEVGGLLDVLGLVARE
ncbi:site-2 protease family protein [Bradymonadaceae bacterium TMQ3]|nr:site-2 protease family protein [Bradymonadaceae bacterium TMQ3]TXC77808.1 site-2 protease family protein [Bradymonadales bacterium TMQ1]